MTDLTRDADEGVNAQVESLLRAHAGEVEGILRGMGFPADVARQSVHDVLMAIAREQKKGRDVKNPKAFPVKVATFRALNELRPLRVRTRSRARTS